MLYYTILYYTMLHYTILYNIIIKYSILINHNNTRDEDLDYLLSSLVTEGANIEKLVDEFNEALTIACNKSFQIHRSSRNAPSHRSDPGGLQA